MDMDMCIFTRQACLIIGRNSSATVLVLVCCFPSVYAPAASWRLSLVAAPASQKQWREILQQTPPSPQDVLSCQTTLGSEHNCISRCAESKNGASRYQWLYSAGSNVTLTGLWGWPEVSLAGSNVTLTGSQCRPAARLIHLERRPLAVRGISTRQILRCAKMLMIAFHKDGTSGKEGGRQRRYRWKGWVIGG